MVSDVKITSAILRLLEQKMNGETEEEDFDEPIESEDENVNVKPKDMLIEKSLIYSLNRKIVFQ
jgi:hypothetical protein